MTRWAQADPSPRSLTEDATDRIREEILAGRRVPSGWHLVEANIATQLLACAITPLTDTAAGVKTNAEGGNGQTEMQPRTPSA